MAERRMFSKRFVNRDSFLELDLSAQALYFHLSVEADDDGFVESPKGIIRKIGASADDLLALESAGFVFVFSSGILVISHWKLHNQIRADRYHKTVFQKEYRELCLDEYQIYRLRKDADFSNGNQSATNWKPDDNQMDTESMLDHVSQEKKRQEESMLSHVTTRGAGLVVDTDNKEFSSRKKAEAKMTADMLNKHGFVYTGHGRGGLEALIMSKLNEGFTVGDIMQAFSDMKNSIENGNNIEDQTAYLLTILQDS